jgi:hypothetical protein
MPLSVASISWRTSSPKRAQAQSGPQKRIFDGTTRRGVDRLNRQGIHKDVGRSAFKLIQHRAQRLQIHVKRSLNPDRIRCVVALGSFAAGGNKAGILIAGQLPEI